MASEVLLPENRMLEPECVFGGWLFEGSIFANILEDKTASTTSVSNLHNSLSLHPRQVTMTQQVTKRAVMESGLSPEVR